MIYQVAWAKALALILGSTVYAVTTVLAVFLGGLAIGSHWIGRWSKGYRDPIRLYALLEWGVASLGAASLVTLPIIRSLYAQVSPLFGAWNAGDAALRCAAAALVLLPSTILMGGTLPVLVRGVGRRTQTFQVRLGRLYWVNTLGAVGGTLVAGFYMLPFMGLRLAVLAAVTLNLISGEVAWQLPSEVEPQRSPVKLPKVPETVAHSNVLLVAFGLVGATAMAYEVAWTRLLVTIFGSSTYAFTIMLATFLGGIALGSGIYAIWARRRRTSLRCFEVTQTLTALAAVLFLFSFLQLPTIVVAVQRAAGNTFRGLLLAQLIGSSIAMLPTTVVFGFNFPLVVSLIVDRSTDGIDESAAVGCGYAANSAGAIVGVILAGLWLIPAVGAFRLVAIMAVVNLALAFTIGARRKTAWVWLATRAAVAAGLLVAVSSSALYNRSLATFGAALYHPLHARGITLQEMADTSDVLFTAEGPNATVTVIRAEDYLALRINGKVDASNRDTHTQLLLGHLGALLHPAPRRALVIGFGSGMTLSALTRCPDIQHLDCVEIEPQVIQAANYLESLNEGVLRNPRVHLALDDARNYLMTTGERYDLISSEPSNPWMAGMANLYTVEFYREAMARLRPGGLFVQWVQGYSLDPVDLRMVMRTFASVFPRVTLWRGEPADFLLVGQAASGPLPLDRLRALWSEPTLQSDFQKLGLQRPSGLLAYHLLDDRDLRRLIGDGPLNTDDLPLLEFHAPKKLFGAQLTEQNRSLIASFRSSLLPEIGFSTAPTDSLLGAAETSAAIGDRERTHGFLDPLLQRTPSLPAVLLNGRLALEERRFQDATKAFEFGRTMNPLSLEAKAGLGRALLGMGDWGTAEALLRDVLARDVEQSQAVTGMLELSTMKKDWLAAAHWQLKRIERDPKLSVREFVRLGRDYLRAGDSANGIYWLRQALERDAYCLAAHRTLAEEAVTACRWGEAKSHLEVAVRYAPDVDPAIYSSLAGVNVALGNSQAAYRALEKGLRIFPGEPHLSNLAARGVHGTR